MWSGGKWTGGISESESGLFPPSQAFLGWTVISSFPYKVFCSRFECVLYFLAHCHSRNQEDHPAERERERERQRERERERQGERVE